MLTHFAISPSACSWHFLIQRLTYRLGRVWG